VAFITSNCEPLDKDSQVDARVSRCASSAIVQWLGRSVNDSVGPWGRRGTEVNKWAVAVLFSHLTLKNKSLANDVQLLNLVSNSFVLSVLHVAIETNGSSTATESWRVRAWDLASPWRPVAIF
jgi:hypothetical protein